VPGHHAWQTRGTKNLSTGPHAVMNDSILQTVLDRLAEPRTRFVFPSEVAASSVLAAALETSGKRALPARRFIGWDAFKSEVFAGSQQGKPSTKAIRTLFARHLMEENARKPFLSSVVPRSASSASGRFARSVASALPALRSTLEGPGDHLADWREIRSRYEIFMSSKGLYEAACLGRHATPGNSLWVLFYTDLTEDWADYSTAVQNLPGVTLILSSKLPLTTVPVARFGTIVEEVRAVLAKIRADVLAGADPAGIMISVASPESTLPILEREARVAGVPLDIREGNPLSECAGGRLLADIIDLAKSRMSFESLRKLLLDASRPWKEKETARRLLNLGIRKHVIAPLPEGPDIWESSIGNDDEARRLFRGLRTASSKVVEARGFLALRTAYDAFKRAFLEDAWSDRQNDEIARALAVLDELDSAANTAGLKDMEGAAEIWAGMLGDTRYLPVSDSGGIAVYRFPVAAGTKPATHFILNLAEGSAVAAARPLIFMRADERQKAGATDRDISAGLVRLLSGSGTSVYMSYSEDGPDGVRPPHPAVAIHEPESLGLPYDRNAWLPNLEAEIGLNERSTLAGSDVFPSQAGSAKIALRTVFGTSGAVWSEGTPAAPVDMTAATTKVLLDSLLRNGTLSISVTTMEAYLSCAFKRIYQRQLGVEALDSGLSFIDNLLIGNVYHDAYRRLFEPLAQNKLPVLCAELVQDVPGEAAAGEAARPSEADIVAAMRAAIEAVERKSGIMARILLETSTPVLERAFRWSAKNLLGILDGYIPVLVDQKELFAPLESLSAELRGRPDLVCAANAGEEKRAAIIVDYKKSHIPDVKDLTFDESGALASLQIPMYTALVTEAGFQPKAAYYLSIEGSEENEKGLRLVYGTGKKPCISEAQVPLMKPALVTVAAQAAQTIRSGHVFIPDISDRGKICARCDLRPVCRSHYTVR